MCDMKEEEQNTELQPFSAGESICALVWLPAFCALALVLDYIGGGWVFTAVSVLSLTGSLIAISHILLNLRRLLGESLGWSLKRRMLTTLAAIVGGPMFCHCLIVAIALKKHRKVTAGCAAAGILLGGAQWLGAFWFLSGILKPERPQMMFFALCAICSYALAVFNTLDLRSNTDLISRCQWVLFASGLALWTLLLFGNVIHTIQVGYADKKAVLSQIETAIGGPIPTHEELLAAAPPEGDFTAHTQLIADFQQVITHKMPDANSSPEIIHPWLEANPSLVAEAEKLCEYPVPRPPAASLSASLFTRDVFIRIAADIIAMKAVATKNPASVELLDALLAANLHSPLLTLYDYRYFEACRKACADAAGQPYTPIPPAPPEKLLAYRTALLLHDEAGFTSSRTGLVLWEIPALQCFAGLPVRLSMDDRSLLRSLKDNLSRYNEATNGMEDSTNPRD